MPETVLYVPGLPGSHLAAPDGTQFFWNGSFASPHLLGPNDLRDDEVRAGDPVLRALKFLFFDLGKQAKSLYELLDGLGCRTVPFGWDWRRPVWEETAVGGPEPGVVSRLAAAIRRERQRAGAPITLICHSTGGLVARAVLEAHPELARDLTRLIAFGVPWGGMVKSFGVICGELSFPLAGMPRSRQIASHSWAAFDLLPPDTAAGLEMVLRESTGGGTTPVSPLVDRSWLAALPPLERAAASLRAAAVASRSQGRSRTFEIGNEALEVVNVVGWGEATPDLATISSDGAEVRVHQRSATATGDPLGLEGGDATVPRRSAAWLQPGGNVQVTTLHLPVGWLTNSKVFVHTALWRNPGGRDLLRHHLAGDAMPPLVYAALDGGDASFGSGSPNVRVRSQALDAAGRPLPGAAIRTRDLVPPNSQIASPFDPANQGRHVISVPKARIRSTQIAQARRLRFNVEITWQDGAEPRSTGRIPFTFLQP